MARSRSPHKHLMDLSVNHPRPAQCSNLTDADKQCKNDAAWRVTRSDATSYLLCTLHKGWLIDMMVKRPDAYAKVTITQLT